MTVLHLKDHGVQRARRAHPALAGKPCLARGTFSAVFEGTRPETVLKLTMDRSNYAYMTDGLSPDGPHKPELFEDHHIVGEASTGEDLYLIEVERLAPLKGPAAHATVLRQVMRQLSRHTMCTPGADGTTFPDSVWSHPGVCGTLAEFLHRLEWFAQNYECRIDAKVGQNYMMRAKDQTVVASDPVFDAKLLGRYRRPAYLAH